MAGGKAGRAARTRPESHRCPAVLRTHSGFEPLLLTKALHDKGLAIELGDRASDDDQTNSICYKKSCAREAKSYADAMGLELGKPTDDECSFVRGYPLEITIRRAAPDPSAASLAELASLIGSGIDPRAGTAIEAAAKNGNLAYTKLLIENGASLDVPLPAAVRAGRMEVTAFLLERGAQASNVVHSAAFVGELRIVEALVAHGAPIDFPDRFGRPPLSVATSGEVAKLLVKRGARLDLADDLGLLPLHWAVLRKNTAVVQVLLDQGADPNAQTPPPGEPSVCGQTRGNTALDLAQKIGATKIASLIASRGGKPTASPVPARALPRLKEVDDF